jgi:hypothetical protein
MSKAELRPQRCDDILALPWSPSMKLRAREKAGAIACFSESRHSPATGFDQQELRAHSQKKCGPYSVFTEAKSVFSAIERGYEWLLTIFPKIELTEEKAYA